MEASEVPARGSAPPRQRRGVVYTLIVIAWVIFSFVFAMGLRVPYSRPLNAVLDFLRDVTEPFLRLFRRLPLRVGPLDLTPIVAILALLLASRVVIALLD